MITRSLNQYAIIIPAGIIKGRVRGQISKSQEHVVVDRNLKRVKSRVLPFWSLWHLSFVVHRERWISVQYPYIHLYFRRDSFDYDLCSHFFHFRSYSFYPLQCCSLSALYICKCAWKGSTFFCGSRWFSSFPLT